MKVDEYDSDDSDITIIANDNENTNVNIEKVSTYNTNFKMADKEYISGNDNSKMAAYELYKYTDKGPYYVICETKEIDEFKLCDLLMRFKVKDIVNGNKFTKDKVSILTKS